MNNECTYSNGALIGIKAITPLHVGQTTDEIVDKGFIRDHLGFPIIYGSSLKGAIKKQVNLDNGKKKFVFGTQDRVGAVVFLDAKLLFIPVRDTEKVCSFATCPLLLKNLESYANVIVNSEVKYGVNGSSLSLKEIIDKLNSSNGSSDGIYQPTLNETSVNAVKLDKIEINGENILEKLELSWEYCYVISDEDFRSIFEKSMIVLWRVGLKEDTKKPKEGALWCEEYLPNDSILISGILYKNEVKNNDNKEEEDIKNLVENNILNNNFIFVGGLETIGKGLIKIIELKRNNRTST